MTYEYTGTAWITYLNHEKGIADQQKQYEAAVEDLTRAIERNPRYTDALLNRGLSSIALNKLDLPDATPASLDQSFRLLSGMIAEPVLTEANIRAEVPIVLAEMRERGGFALVRLHEGVRHRAEHRDAEAAAGLHRRRAGEAGQAGRDALVLDARERVVGDRRRLRRLRRAGPCRTGITGVSDCPKARNGCFHFMVNPDGRQLPDKAERNFNSFGSRGSVLPHLVKLVAEKRFEMGSVPSKYARAAC